MLTLPDPRHEAFATLRASGHDVASAYVHAGYSVKNIKQRSRKLLQNPDIQARIEHLKTCLPRIGELHAHHCPSLRLMPETRHEMLVWLWQVMNGTRLVKPAQMRAAGLYCRMRGWHLAKLLPAEEPATSTSAPAPTPASSTATAKDALTECEEVLLAMVSLENIEYERTGMPIPKQKLERFQSLMADHAHPSCRSTPLGRPNPEPAPESPAHSAIPQPQNSPKSPTQSPSKLTLPQRLNAISSPKPHPFLFPAFAPLPRPVLSPKINHPHPYLPAHRLPRRQPWISFVIEHSKSRVTIPKST